LLRGIFFSLDQNFSYGSFSVVCSSFPWSAFWFSVTRTELSSSGPPLEYAFSRRIFGRQFSGGSVLGHTKPDTSPFPLRMGFFVRRVWRFFFVQVSSSKIGVCRFMVSPLCSTRRSFFQPPVHGVLFRFFIDFSFSASLFLRFFVRFSRGLCPFLSDSVPLLCPSFPISPTSAVLFLDPRTRDPSFLIQLSCV